MRVSEINEKLQNTRDAADLTDDEKQYVTRLGFIVSGLAIIGGFVVIKKVAQIIS